LPFHGSSIARSSSQKAPSRPDHRLVSAKSYSCGVKTSAHRRHLVPSTPCFASVKDTKPSLANYVKWIVPARETVTRPGVGHGVSRSQRFLQHA
jgi:hypothetical protein